MIYKPTNRKYQLFRFRMDAIKAIIHSQKHTAECHQYKHTCINYLQIFNLQYTLNLKGYKLATQAISE